VAAVYRETNLRWTVFLGVWTTGLAYIAATAFYQAATFQHHPASSLAWVLTFASVLAAVVATLRYLGQKDRGMTPALLDVTQA